MLEHVTDSRYIPLALLSGVGGRMQFVDLMNQTISLSGLDAVQTKVLLQTMRGQRLISGSFSSGSYVQLEQSGAELLVSQKEAKERLQLAEKEAKQHAEEKRQKKFSNVLAIAAIFEHLIVFILGVLVEHHIQLFAWIASLFH